MIRVFSEEAMLLEDRLKCSPSPARILGKCYHPTYHFIFVNSPRPVPLLKMETF